jgi:sulfur transfer complex TusBCD TusB component (DsrH family)
VAKKVLNIVETAYRATLEEQDDTILWLSRMLKKNGVDLSVLLRSNAVNYAVRGQDASGLRFGDIDLAHPPTIDHDVQSLVENGVPVYYVSEDAAARGISETQLIGDLKAVARKDLPGLLDEFEQVWHW